MTEKISQQQESKPCQENRDIVIVKSFKEALIELYKQVLFSEYSEETISNLLGGEITYEGITSLIKEWNINGRSSLNGERLTLVLDIDGLFNNNSLKSIISQRIDTQAVHLLEELNSLLPEANILFITSRPRIWNRHSWQSTISQAAGIKNSPIPFTPQNKDNILHAIIEDQPLRILFTDAGKNLPERVIMPFLGRRDFLHDLYIKDENSFFVQALEILKQNLSNFIFVDSGDYSKSQVVSTIPGSKYIGVLSKAKWDKLVLAANQAVQMRKILTFTLLGTFLQNQ